MGNYFWYAIAAQLLIAIALGFCAAIVIYLFVSVAESFSAGPKAEAEKRLTRTLWKAWLFSSLFFIGAFTLANAIIFALPFVGRLYLVILRILKVQLTQSLVAATIVLAAFGAYQFKKAQQRWYGIVEVMFAAISVIVALKTTAPANELGLVAALVAATYVGSRGFANIFAER